MPRNYQRPQLPSIKQFLIAPITMRRIAVLQLNHNLTYQEAHRWYTALAVYQWHLKRTYGEDWKNAAQPAERVHANVTYFDPHTIPDGVGRDLVHGIIDGTLLSDHPSEP